MIGAAEARESGASGVVLREADCLHHRFRARHVERHLVEAGNVAQPADIRIHDRMIGAENRTKIADERRALFDTFLEDVVAEQVETVRPAEVVQSVAVDVRDGRTVGGLEEHPGPESFANEACVGEGHAVTAREGQVRQH